MAKYVGKGKKGGKSRRPYARRARKASAKSNFKKRVLDVVRGQVETKQAWTSFPPTAFNSFATSAADLLQIIPSIAKGTDDNDRIGDQVHPQRLHFRAIFNMYPQGPSISNGYKRIWCRFLIVTPKSFPQYAAAVNNAATWLGTVLKKGGTTSAMNGDITDANSPVNTDAVICHFDKLMFFGEDMFYAGTTSVGTMISVDHLTKFVNKTFSFGRTRKFKYDDSLSAGLLPSDIGYIGLLSYGFCDGSTADSVTTRMQLQYVSWLDYEDA